MTSCFLHVLYPIQLVNSKSLIFLFGCILAFETATSQQINTRLYTVNDGLPTLSVFGVYEDSRGYLWVGTTNGISRFDGRTFMNIGISDGLPSSYAGVSLEDSKRRIWLATNKGMALLKGSNAVTFPLEDSLKIDYVYRIIETRNKQIWALTIKGVYRFGDTIWRKVKLFPGWENEACRDVVETDSGIYLNYGHLVAFRNSNGNWHKLGEDHSIGHFFVNFRISRNRIAITSRQGVSLIENNQLKTYFNWDGGPGYYSTYVDEYDRLWYCKQDGGLAINVSRPGQWEKIELQIQKRNGILFQIKSDSHGNIWAGTAEGLMRIQQTPYSLINENEKFKGGAANSGVVLPDSSLLFPSSHGFLISYPDKPHKNYFLDKLPEDIIDAASIDNVGKIWFVTRGQKLYRISGQKVTDYSYLLDHLSTGSMNYCAYDKRRQKLFIACDNKLLFGDENGFEEFIPSNTRKPIAGCISLLVAKNGSIILVTDPGEINLIDLKNNLTKWRERRGSLIEDREGNIWVSDHYSGLTQYSFDNSGNLFEIRKITSKDGLQNIGEMVMGVDSLDRIWLISSTGLDILQKTEDNEWQVFNYSKNWGLNVNWELTRIITDAKGDVWITTFHDLIMFDSKNVKLKKEVPKVVIEKVQVNLKDLDWHDLTDSLWAYQQLPLNPRFSYAENTVTIFFNGISYSASPKLEYTWQLNSGDSAWTLPSSNSSISFEDLRPGEYHFKVKTRDQASAWSLPAEFSFTILTPFWMRWWFITLCVLSVGGIAYSIYKYRINQLKKLLSIRTKISQDLHDELGSTLTSINILSRVSRSNLDKDKSRASALLEKITEQSENMQQSMSDIVWAIRPDNDKLENLAIRMREYLSQTADPKGLKVELLVEETLLKESLPMQQRQNVFLIFKEAVNNAVKYSKCNKITVHLARRDKNIVLIIEDDGVGLSPGMVSTSNGMKNMDSRARMLNGTLDIQSSSGAGTRIILQYPAT